VELYFHGLAYPHDINEYNSTIERGIVGLSYGGAGARIII
jgi:hypothetical protein